jgi:hypothetical protein
MVVKGGRHDTPVYQEIVVEIRLTKGENTNVAQTPRTWFQMSVWKNTEIIDHHEPQYVS